MAGATSLVQLILKKWGDDAAGAAKELEEKVGFPESVANRIATGELPMDAESIARRADGQGYGEVLYHGSTNPLLLESAPMEVGKRNAVGGNGLFTTDNPRVASTYAYDSRVNGGTGPDGGTIYPLRVRDVHPSERVTVKDRGHRGEEYTTFWDEIPADNIRGIDSPYDSDQILETDSINRVSKKQGKKVVEYSKLMDSAEDAYGIGETDAPSNVTAVLDNTLLRSPNAAFDPQYTGSNIMGGAALPVAAGLLAAGQSDDADAGFVTRGGKTLLEAFHGSPHKFDKFSMDQIGTGEGAQAYGHGLYFADSEGVAKGYREALTQPRIETNGKVVPSPYTSDILETFSDEVAEETRIQAESWAELFELQADAVGRPIDREILDDWVEAVATGNDRDFPTNLSRQIADLEDEVGMSANDLYDIREQVEDSFSIIGGNLSQIDSMDDIGYVSNNLPEWAQPVFDRYFDGKMVEVAPEGALYRTEIDVTPESLLDYDMPLRTQPQSVQDAFVNAYRSHVNDGTEDGLLVSELLDGSSPQDALNLFDDSKGSQSYRTLADMVGGEDKASALLNEQGVRGIKFADGNSRRAKQAMIDGKSDGFVGDENYVIFDDSLINIAERGNADPRLLAGTAAGTAGLLAAPMLADKDKPLPVPTGGDIAESVLNILGMPMTGLQGIGRGLFGLATGEDFTEAAAQAGNTMDVGWKDGRVDVRSMNPDKGADQLEGYVTEKTGDESLGWLAKMGLLLGGI